MQVYYYNAKTRESAWTKPENVKIITQSEVEQMAAQANQQQVASSAGVTPAVQVAPVQGMFFGQNVIADLPAFNTQMCSIKLNSLLYKE